MTPEQFVADLASENEVALARLGEKSALGEATQLTVRALLELPSDVRLAALAEQDVVRRAVAMDDPALVRVGERLGDRDQAGQ